MRLKGRQLVTRRNFQMGGSIAERVGVDGETAIRTLHANALTGTSVSANTATSCPNAYLT
jgi:hypothetical protein